MSYLDVLENSDRDSMGKIELVFHRGKSTYNHLGTEYEIHLSNAKPGIHRIFKYDFIDDKFELINPFTNKVATETIERVVKIVKTTIYEN